MLISSKTAPEQCKILPWTRNVGAISDRQSAASTGLKKVVADDACLEAEKSMTKEGSW